MADAVVHCGPGQHHKRDREYRSESEQNEHRPPYRRNVAAARRHQRPRGAADAEQQKDFRFLEQEQFRHIAARHVRHRNRHAVEHLLPRLFEEM
jgi:hypothetical protein